MSSVLDNIVWDFAISVRAKLPTFDQNLYNRWKPAQRQYLTPTGNGRYTPILSPHWQKEGGLGALLSGEGSVNEPKLRYSIMRRIGNASQRKKALEFWRAVFAHEWSEWMVSEVGSWIYGEWHFLTAAALIDDPELGPEALEWCAYWIALLALMEVDGRILNPGQRSANHAPEPDWTEFIYAIATGGDSKKAFDGLKKSGLAPMQSWIYFSTLALKDPIQRAGKRAKEYEIEDLQERGMRRPFRVYRTADSNDRPGVAAWIEDGGSEWSCDNGNTPPIPGIILYPDGTELTFPKNGGEMDKLRVRQRFDHCDVWRDGDTLRYKSDIYGEDSAPLPTGKVVLDVMIGVKS